MFEPTMFFRPFGDDGPKIALFGKNTGDWNPSCFQQPGDHQGNAGLYGRFDTLAEKYHFLSIAMPVPLDCNTKICSLKDLTTNIQNGVGRVVLRRGVRADGMVLPRGSTGAIASADCPTIVAFSPGSKTVILAHGGRKSLIGGDRSVVDEIMKKAGEYCWKRTKVFIACGISGKNYHFQDLVPSVGVKFGKECVVGGTGLDLKKIIAKQFLRYNVGDITTDVIDTYGDRGTDEKFLWHSYRREGTPERNLVLVINN